MPRNMGRASPPIVLPQPNGSSTRPGANTMRALNVTPHVAQNTTGRRSAIDGRTTRHAG